MAVAKIKNKNYESINLEKTIKILIELAHRSQVFTLNDFECKYISINLNRKRISLSHSCISSY